MEEDTGLEKYYALLLILVAGMVGVSFSGDFFNLYIFWEMMCISSYALVSFRKYTWEPVEAGFKYLVMSTTGSLLALYGISLLFGFTGTVNFQE
ncbi:MAG: proton-conducting transporter membrane subunit [Candidatus Bathyarchaeia archaeon]